MSPLFLFFVTFFFSQNDQTGEKQFWHKTNQPGLPSAGVSLCANWGIYKPSSILIVVNVSDDDDNEECSLSTSDTS